MKSLTIVLLLLNVFFESNGQDLILARKHIDTLASVSMKGRGYIESGEKKASKYIEKYFQEYNLLKIDTSYFKYFEFDINTFPGEIFVKNGRKKLVCGEDYIVSPDAPSLKGKYKLTYIDTLIFTDIHAQKWFLNSDFSKTALAMEPKYKSKFKSIGKQFTEKLKEAPVLVILQHKKLTASLSSHPSHQLIIDVLRDSIDLGLKNLKINIEAEVIHKYRTQNVLGFVKGTMFPDSFIVISAHYDHLGTMGKDVYFPGANDNASGISMMLSLAKYYTENPLKCSVLFIAFGA